MNQRIRHRLWLLVCMLSVVIVFPRQVYADMGPKPSVHIQFENMVDLMSEFGTHIILVVTTFIQISLLGIGTQRSEKSSLLISAGNAD